MQIFDLTTIVGLALLTFAFIYCRSSGTRASNFELPLYQYISFAAIVVEISMYLLFNGDGDVFIPVQRCLLLTFSSLVYFFITIIFSRPPVNSANLKHRGYSNTDRHSKGVTHMKELQHNVSTKIANINKTLDELSQLSLKNQSDISSIRRDIIDLVSRISKTLHIVEKMHTVFEKDPSLKRTFDNNSR